MIEIRYEKDYNRTAAYDGEKEVGKCTYTVDGSVWTVDHTIVDPEYGGQGIAGKLLDEVVNQARIQNIKIIPVCSYAVKKFDTVEAYQDVRK